MKRLIMSLSALLAFSGFAFAQQTNTEDANEAAQDKMQQEPPRQTERSQERAAVVSAQNKVQSKKNERTAKVIKDKQATDSEARKKAARKSTTVK